MTSDLEQRWLPGGRHSSMFTRRVVTLAPGQTHRYDAAQWQDTIALVQRGTVELQARDGSCCRFGAGALLCCAGLDVRALHNPGHTPTRMVLISRRKTDSFPRPGPSHSQQLDTPTETEC